MKAVRRSALGLGLSVALALLLAGCADPGPQRPRHGLLEPQKLVPVAAAAEASVPTPWPAERWWAGFGDHRLEALVDQALASQPSLQQAQARVAQAAALADAVARADGPSAQLTADLTWQRYSERGLVPPSVAGSTRWTKNLQLGGRWELDLFGRQRAALAAAIGQQRAAEAEAQAARVLLAAGVATHWFALARQQAQQGLAAQALQLHEHELALVNQRVAAGLDNVALRLQTEARLAQSRVELEALADAVARERHALAELSGQAPQALATLDASLAPLRQRPLPGTLGADLLGRRADLVAQRWRVEAALRDVDGARAQFYPDINLMAFVGLSSLGLDQLLDLGARTFGAGPALRLPLFNGGSLRAQLTLRGAEADAAIEAWNGTLLRALREVADEVAGLQALQRQQAAQQQALAAAEAGLALARQRQQAGLGNRLAMLAAEAALLAQRRQAVDLKARLLAGDVSLTRALGGGYRDDTAGLPLAAARP